ncbi:hypothetical protein CXB51_002770 [Gossypium anomalum]|uniref:RNase H type-1 domain-containing protein n=1 Tax=Gossypium anomalum TaxID=47600 RepID=A0A8J5ZJX5_9ROSI|nr:hypothetical protein CXB51_002770 [Gossypium anomalum]
MQSLMWARAVHDDIQFLEGSWWFCPAKCSPSRSKANAVVIHWTPPPPKVMAIKTALEVFIGMGWYVRVPFIIESGSSVVLEGMLERNSRS